MKIAQERKELQIPCDLCQCALLESMEELGWWQSLFHWGKWDAIVYICRDDVMSVPGLFNGRYGWLLRWIIKDIQIDDEYEKDEWSLALVDADGVRLKEIHSVGA